MESDYQRAWRERGEVEYALRKWWHNQQSPVFLKVTGVFGGLVGGAMFCAFVSDPAWNYAPILIFAAMYAALPMLTPSILRRQAKARDEAKATLQRLGIWKDDPTHDQ